MKKTQLSEFIKATLIRALRTVAQTAAAAIGTGAVFADVNWVVVGSTAGMAGILSILTAIATGLPECPTCAVKEEGEAEVTEDA
jgi:hypothetical protein